jgi:peroxiredoxin
MDASDPLSGTPDLAALPPDLPVPEDDGAANHLVGEAWPAGLVLPSTDGVPLDFSKLPGRVVIYVFPMMGRPGTPLPDGWDEVPGARGCTVQSLAYSKNLADLEAAGVAAYGISNQSLEELEEAKERLGLQQTLLSDSEGVARHALRLPTFSVDDLAYLRRLTMALVDGVIEKVWYPVFPPGRDVDEVREWNLP